MTYAGVARLCGREAWERGVLQLQKWKAVSWGKARKWSDELTTRESVLLEYKR
jgi:hypothetical protein